MSVSLAANDGGMALPLSAPESIHDLRLVDAHFVAENCHGRGGSAVLLEAHFSSPDHPLPSDASSAAHIPSAIQVHPSYLEAGTDRSKYYPNYDHPADGNLLPGQELTQAILQLGISPDTLVVVYGAEPDGTMAAARLVWSLLYAGVKRVRLFDGGLESWRNFGGEVSATIRTVTCVEASPTQPRHSWRPRS